jgi:hypothetical protein
MSLRNNEVPHKVFYDDVNGRLVDDMGAIFATLDVSGSTVTLPTASIINAKVAAPKLGIQQQTVGVAAFTDGGATSGTLVTGITIPAGAVYLYSLITGITGFAGDTTATIKIGDGSTADRYNTGTPSVFSTAAQGVAAGVVSGTAWHTAAATITITITSSTDFTLVKTNAAGALTLTSYYYQAI